VPSDGNEVRGSLIRYLLLGGCKGARPHPAGVTARVAYVSGTLDMEECKTTLSLILGDATFKAAPRLMDAEVGFISFSGSRVPGLEAERLKVARAFRMQGGFQSDGPVELSGSEVGSQLSFSGAKLFGGGSEALSAQDIKVGNSVFLNEGFSARGTVDLNGARISGQLACRGGTFDGRGGKALNCENLDLDEHVFLDDGFSSTGGVNLSSAKIGGRLFLTGGHFRQDDGLALDLARTEIVSDIIAGRQCMVDGDISLSGTIVGGTIRLSGPTVKGCILGIGLRVSGTFRWSEVEGKVPLFDLEDANLGKLEDDRDSWGVVDRYFLNGLRYGATGPAMSVRARLEWLDKNSSLPDRDDKGKFLPSFDPQPYSQLAKVMEGHGHRRAAARVLFEREKRLRRAEHRRAHARLNGDGGPALESIKADISRVADLLFGVLFGFGHRPLRGLIASFVIIVLAGILYGNVYDAGQMAPASDVVITSEDWIAAVSISDACPLRGAEDRSVRLAAGCVMPLDVWTGAAEGHSAAASATDYETFNRWLYGLDLFVPLDALGQETAWAPSKDRGWWDFAGYYLRWAFQTMGWVIAALGAATLTGLVGRRD